MARYFNQCNISCNVKSDGMTHCSLITELYFDTEVQARLFKDEVIREYGWSVDVDGNHVAIYVEETSSLDICSVIRVMESVVNRLDSLLHNLDGGRL